MTNVISIDPGETTGVFYTLHSNHGGFDAKGWLVMDGITGLLDTCAFDIIIIEKFNLYDKRSKANAQWPLDIIGACKWEAHNREIDIALQWNRDKNQVTDQMLDDRGILTRPKHKGRHINDAARHYVYWATRNERNK